ncbi:G-protein coupled receptor moody-like [Anneissia japonica]|uniref:G-protein coupled receptor moody-like n=1 Tax=Anneissia japonica TaxID=1529436 RepID=UPI00142566B4|nr:G-protein coupled receptor moody-like [Anneissia japonica]
MTMTGNDTDTDRDNMGLLIFECTVISCMSIVGSVGNTLTIIAVLTNRHLREPAQYLVVSLAIADLIPCLITDSVYVVSAWHQEWFLPNAYIVCQIIGLLTVLCLEASVMNLTLIAVNRYVCIVKFNKYKKIFTPRRTVFFCVMAWIPPIIGVVIPISHQFNVFGIHARMLSCSVEATDIGWWYLTLLLVIYIPIAMSVITFCYINIFRKARASRRRIEQHATTTRGVPTTNNSQSANPGVNSSNREPQPINSSTYQLASLNDDKPSPPPKHEQQNIQRTRPIVDSESIPHSKLNLKKEVRLTVNLFIIFVIFVLCWLPITLAIIFDSNFKAPDAVWQVVSILALANSSCDPVVYVWRSKHFRQSYKRILKCSLGSTTSLSSEH